MNVTIINDCRDDNAKVRQLARTKALLGCDASFVGVANDLEAAGCIIDVLDAYGEDGGIIIANVAPRNGSAKRWPNGTPFAYARIGRSLVLASVSGQTWSLISKLGLADTIEVMDIPAVLVAMVDSGVLNSSLVESISKSQFRSYEFLPRVAAFLAAGGGVPSECFPLGQIDRSAPAVWWTDNFGNCKTNLLPAEIGFAPGVCLGTAWGGFACYDRLKDVPDGESAAIVGSSGFGSDRFVELVIQGAGAAARFGIRSGDLVL